MKKRYALFLFWLAAPVLYANTVEIESLKFEAYEERGITIFTGNVAIKKNEDRMFADKVVVFVGDDKQIKKFEASGHTSFKMKMEDNSSFEGQSDEFVYTPGTGELILTGNAKIKDITNNREISGERVILYEKQKVAKVMGEEKKPVKLIFEIEEKAKP